jgi:hypothetical protein
MIVYLFSFMVNNHWVLLNRIETMTTYNSYQEAKIANPERAIFSHQGKFGTNADILYAYDMKSRGEECNPADHCMTVEKFLADGHKFVEGDLIFRDRIKNITNGNAGLMGVKSPADSEIYILRAAALETKEPKRTNVEYVECDNLQDTLDKFESMSGFEFYPDDKGCGDRINSVRYLALAYGNNSLYRKVETPIEWWEDVVDYVNQHGFAEFVNGKLAIQVSMTRDQSCDLARILLEQGE